jgi:hypothetical protein
MPQPIDPNTELARMTAAERIQQIADRASLAAQARNSSDAAARQIEIESQVQQMNQKSEEVEDEMRRRQPYMGRRKKKRDKEKEKNKEEILRSHTFYTDKEKEDIADDPDLHDFDFTV